MRVAPCFSKPETRFNAVNLPTTLGLQAGVAPTTVSPMVGDPANRPCMTADIRHDWSLETLRELYDTPLMELVFRAASVHRKFHDPAEMQVSKLISIKTGACPEDCSYCAQSSRYSTGVSPERLMEKEKVVEIANRAKQAGVSRVCLGAAWREVKDNAQFDRVLDIDLIDRCEEVDGENLHCARPGRPGEPSLAASLWRLLSLTTSFVIRRMDRATMRNPRNCLSRNSASCM